MDGDMSGVKVWPKDKPPKTEDLFDTGSPLYWAAKLQAELKGVGKAVSLVDSFLILAYKRSLTRAGKIVAPVPQFVARGKTYVYKNGRIREETDYIPEDEAIPPDLV